MRMDGPPPRRPIPAVEIPSDDEDEGDLPLAAAAGNREQIQVLLVLDDDDPTPQKKMPTDTSHPSKINQDTTPLFVPETPAFASHASGLRPCSTSSSPFRASQLICLESDDDYDKDDYEKASPKGFSHTRNCCAPADDEFDIGSSYREDHGPTTFVAQDQLCMDVETQVHCDHIHRNTRMEIDLSKRKKRGRVKATSVDKTEKDEELATKKQKKEEKHILEEERKQKRQVCFNKEEKLQKKVLKAEAAQLKKLQKEKDKWEKGKFALKSIIAEIDVKVVENGAVGGHLLGRFADKGLTYRITTNPMEKSILWKMSIPDQISELSSMGAEVPYVVFVYEAEEFCNLLLSSSFQDHVYEAQRQYPSFKACYITNKLMSYVKKREQNQYKNPSGISGWQRPPIEEVLAKLTTDFNQVHSRLCMDEADLAEHIVGLTSSLAACRFRKKLTWLSANANGSLVSKGFIDKSLIKRSSWLKALVAIPKVQPRFAIAISKKYPTMRSLLNVYMDTNKSVHEKEFFLKDLIIEGELGNESKRLGEACSKRVYRILMAQIGVSKTDDVENGADFF